MKALLHIDEQVFQWLNAMNSPWLDPIMVFISHKLSWIPVYLLLLFIVWQREPWKRLILFLLCIAALITLTDQTTSSLLKPTIQRYRPCRTEANLGFEVHTVNKCGGKYGFASSHAANFFGLASFLALYFRQRKWSILFLSLATLVAYTRIYLGVHYPGDVIAGALIGVLFGLLVYQIYRKLGKNSLFSS